MLDYLNEQTARREDYEIIWIEYYDRRSPQIEDRVNRPQTRPVIDRWIVLDMPRDIYYHKHLMYNMGILASRGTIVCFCDSDAVVGGGFVASILAAFEAHRGIVLHLDQVRNKSRKFYPFNHPSVEEIVGEGCDNYKGGTTTGLRDTEDFLHTRNYGACMCALKEDLIKIGGADQHISYLGHICGPYEMTFRLINAGKKEVWHQKEFLYHTWHPGSDGHRNYLGPHDGKNMSTTALRLLNSGRVLPLVENPAVNALRQGNGAVGEQWLSYAVPAAQIKSWKIGPALKIRSQVVFLVQRCRNKLAKLARAPGRALETACAEAALFGHMVRLSVRQLFLKGSGRHPNRVLPKSALFKVQLVFLYIWRTWQNNLYVLSVCRQVIEELRQEGVRQVAFYGVNDWSRMLGWLAQRECVQVVVPASLTGYDGKVIVASFMHLKDKINELESQGISPDNIILLQ